MSGSAIQRVLVANRGEIAVRVIRACREAGMQVVAVHSDADANARHVRLADQAVAIGPAPSAESYLVGERILKAALDTGCDAIHPGYGFLSENTEFAEAVKAAGLIWIGPPAGAIRSMGSKTAARQVMSAAGVPVVPGTLEALADPEEAVRIAGEIGYPVMLKAAAGGGGKGMRAVFSESELLDALRSAQSEAAKSFGDDAVYIEKLVVGPRHIEIQVLADTHGNTLHLFERDCSIQRRHQKVVEEAPCAVLPEHIRQAMALAAVRAAEAVDYEGAGTVEFLWDGGENFYFLEMNTRLQVEHPITELITGVDLVAAQLRIAAGEPIGIRQEDLSIHGHAIECRIYAEDVAANFRPSPGHLVGYREPTGPFVRVDSGVEQGDDIQIHYDPMLAKLIVWGEDRDQALGRLRRALDEYMVVGIPTSIPFFQAILKDDAFCAADYNTGFITPEWLAANQPEADTLDAAILGAILAYERDTKAKPAAEGDRGSMWKRAHRWSSLRRGMM